MEELGASQRNRKQRTKTEYTRGEDKCHERRNQISNVLFADRHCCPLFFFLPRGRTEKSTKAVLKCARPCNRSLCRRVANAEKYISAFSFVVASQGTAGPGYVTVRRRKLPASLLSNSARVRKKREFSVESLSRYLFFFLLPLHLFLFHFSCLEERDCFARFIHACEP